MCTPHDCAFILGFAADRLPSRTRVTGEVTVTIGRDLVRQQLASRNSMWPDTQYSRLNEDDQGGMASKWGQNQTYNVATRNSRVTRVQKKREVLS